MKNVMNGPSCDNSQATTQAHRLADLRYQVLDTVNGSSYATADEKAKTAASVAQCQSEAVLIKWYCNLLTLLSGRELAPPTQPVAATGGQKEEITRLLNHVKIERREKTKVLLVINRLEAQEADNVIKGLLTKIKQREGVVKAAPVLRFFSMRDLALHEQESRFYSMQERNERMAYAETLNR